MPVPRSIATLLLLVCAVSLGSCVAVTDPATNVGSFTARLNGHGHTDSTPARFYFEYATQRADLGTASAKRTPTRDAPANVRNFTCQRHASCSASLPRTTIRAPNTTRPTAETT